MSAGPLERRLHGVAIYNPDLLSKDELVTQFVARQDLLDHLTADLHRAGFKQHQIIVGTRGMGKTTLLRRLRYVVEDDPKLSDVWMPLTFPEEQYNVARLSDLYLNIIDALGDTLEQRGRREEAAALDEAVEALPQGDEGRRAASALELLLSTAQRTNRRLLLLMDNLDLILERLRKQKNAQWSFRELLSSEDRILLIGAMPVVIGATYEHGAPFYDFFRIHELRGLSRDETRAVLTRLSRELGAPAVEKLLETDPARIDTLHTLTAGNPRTIVLLFGVLAQGTEGDVRSDLEKLLDQSTPLYKSRFEALSVQSQQVVDAVAIHWDPISAGELTEKLPMDVNAVSAQLNRLVQQGVLEKVEYHPATKIGFQVAERFFNIWYLMRASRRVRRRLIWLVQFLRLFYGADQVRTQAKNLLRLSLAYTRTDKLRHAELCLAIAQLIEDDRPTRIALESNAIRTLLADMQLSEQIPAMLDLDGEDASLRVVVDRETWVRDFNRAIDDSGLKGRVLERARKLIVGAGFTRRARLELARMLPGMTPVERRTVLANIEDTTTALRRFFGATLSDHLARALELGYMDDLGDKDGAVAAAEVLDWPDIMIWALGAIDERDLRDLLDKSNAPYIRVQLALLLSERGDVDGAIALLTTAREHEKFAFQDFALGVVYERAGRVDDAVREFAGAVSQQRRPVLLLRYGNALIRAQRYSEAESILREVLTASPSNALAARQLAWLLAVGRNFDQALKVARQFGDVDSTGSLRRIEAASLLATERVDEGLDLLKAIANWDDMTSAGSTLETVQMLFIWDAADDAVRLLQKLFERSVDVVMRDAGDALLRVLETAAINGYSASVIRVLDALELQDALRPAYEALRVIESGDFEPLKRLATEARDAATHLAQQWHSTREALVLMKKKPPAKPKRKRSRR